MTQRSLFSKYFIVCATAIMLSITAVGSIMMLFVSQHFKDEKYELLVNNARNASSLVATDYMRHNYSYYSYDTIYNGFFLLSVATESDLFFADPSGRTIICSHDEACVHKTYLVVPAIMEQAVSTEYRELGTFGEMYRNSYYTVGVPVYVEQQLLGVVFISSPADSLTTMLNEILRIFAVSSLAVLLFTFVMVYIVTNRLVRPLRQMVYATKCFSKGDFTQRIAVSDYSEIGQLSVAFNNMASALATLESTRRSFIANVSHELKTPMTTIIGFIDGILDGTIPPEKHEYYLKIVSDEAQRLSRLVRSMLNIAKIEAGEMNITYRTFDINDIVCQSLFSFEQKIENKQLDVRGLDIAEKVLVEADADLIHQVVYNLIDNAVKFANEGGYLEFNYHVENAVTYIAVRNSGAGISQEDIPRVFDRFYKTDKSRSQDKQGVGLGLHIVKSIVNLHSGDIFIRSEEGQYTEFVFSLPTAKNHSKHKKNEKSS